ncbi:MAG: SUMF1/EgtB/PvdO family nonheme iron enzyme [Rhodospirillaceae bacterium]|nr:SUMF1/EgtB/PvdO family nonheme iron enzyme [Rhodospirillaceae bacterium]
MTPNSFDVTTVRDADRVGMNEALRVFTRESAGADVALVFYAGHGLEVNGVNYLVPVDARLERDTDVRFETVALDDVLAATLGASLRVVILDACRDNPLARSMQRTGASRSVSRGSFGELDEGLLRDETLVAYAAAAGTTAADGGGRNSPYTSALLAYLEQPLEIGILFREVRARVLEATNGQQRPHEYASLLDEHYLGGASAPVTVAASTSTEALVEQENLFWQSISDSENPADFQAYLEQFPNGVFARVARNRMTALGGATSGPTVVEGPRPTVSDPPVVNRPVLRNPGTRFRDCPSCPEMVVLRAGTFRMGCKEGETVFDCYSMDAAKPVHEVQVASFALSIHEVTRAEYAAFVSATSHEPGGCGVRSREWETRRFRRDRWVWNSRFQDQASWRAPGFDQGNDHPVVCVSWEDASAYVEWLSAETGAVYRLPSEAEWEYAARAGTATNRFVEDRLCDHGNIYDRTAEEPRSSYNYRDAPCTDGFVWTAPVGSFPANAFGLRDMRGNVEEWVADCWHDDYVRAPQDGSAWTDGGECGGRVLRDGSWFEEPANRVVRGGSWFIFYQDVHWAYRGALIQHGRLNFLGFRVAKTLD